MNNHEKLNYLEIPAKDIAATKTFFTKVFGWVFTDYGPEYTAFDNQGLEGGFYQSNKISTPKTGAILPIFYSKDLPETQTKIEQANGKITKPTYPFPGGHRFHFTDPSGNEFAVWSENT